MIASTAMLTRVATVLCAFSLAGFGGAAYAQVTIPQEYGKTIKTAEAIGVLGEGAFGEEINYYTGATTFTATDVSLPGNDGLPVSFGRRLAVASRDWDVNPGDGMWGDWDLDIPHLEGVFAESEGWAVQNLVLGHGWGDPNQRCSAGGLVQPVTATGYNGGLWNGGEYWQGYQMYVPGAGSQEMLRVTTNPNLPTDGKTYKWLTAGQWFFSCLPTTANGYPGEGFLAVSPQGVRYYFNWFVTRPASTVRKEQGSVIAPIAPMSATTQTTQVTPMFSAQATTSLDRVEVWALVTRIEDRFNNFVTYTYDTALPWRLKSITASDGRTLTVGYVGNRISSVSDGTRTWTYAVTANGFEVTLPDAKKWIYAMGNVRKIRTEPEPNQNIVSFCQRTAGGATQPIYTATITHPSGAVGTFRFQSRVHGRSYVEKGCVKPDPSGPADYARYPYVFDAMGIVDKTITGLGIPANTKWTYTYGPTNQSWAENCTSPCVDTKTAEVTGPGEWTRYTFSNHWELSEGKLLKVETGTGPTNILRTETTTYLLDPTWQRYPDVLGPNPFDRGDRTTEIPQPVIRRDILQQGTTFTWQVKADANGTYDFDRFARPTKITRSSNATP